MPGESSRAAAGGGGWVAVDGSYFSSFSMLSMPAVSVTAQWLLISHSCTLELLIWLWPSSWPSCRIPSAWLWRSQILWFVPQIQLRMVKTNPCSQAGEKELLGGPSPEFPGSTVELWEIWDLPPGNKGQTASSCTRGRLGWILSQFLPGKGCKALEGVAQGSVGVSSL